MTRISNIQLSFKLEVVHFHRKFSPFDFISAVIPVTDAEHNLLTVHFSVDPGMSFVFGQDEYYTDLVTPLIAAADPARHLGLLNSYMELVCRQVWTCLDMFKHD